MQGGVVDAVEKGLPLNPVYYIPSVCVCRRANDGKDEGDENEEVPGAPHGGRSALALIASLVETDRRMAAGGVRARSAAALLQRVVN